jgi:hypothetical protein
MRTRIAVLALAGLIGAACLVLDEHSLSTRTAGFVSAAQARVGRPLTPVSVAGVARRTARRCAAGVYYC